MLILRCDAIGCGKETEASWLPSGRIIARDMAFWLLPGADFKVGCCFDHAATLCTTHPMMERRSETEQ
jgi:hypothetical protein